MNSIVRILWIISFITACLTLILSYGFLPKDMVLMGFEYTSISKSVFFNSYLIILALLFFISRLFHKGIREMNWAFLFPLSRRWMENPESRDQYREHIDSWIMSIFMTFNLLFTSTIFLFWSGNDRLVFAYQQVFITSLLLFSFVLILVIIIPPFLIFKGPKHG